MFSLIVDIELFILFIYVLTILVVIYMLKNSHLRHLYAVNS